jgi:hypothetical protein
MIIFTSIALAGLSILIFLNLDSVLRNAFFIACIFYFVSATIHHKHEGSLGASIISEYISILALSFVLLYGIN